MKAIRATERVKFTNVLFLTDFSEPSDTALPFATGIARAYGSNTFVLHVLTPDPLLYSTPVSLAVAEEAQEDAAKAGMQRISSQLAGLPHETALEWGVSVWPGVEQALKLHSIDLIVAGTHGRTGAEKLLLGSVAEEIFRRSPVPVLTVGPAVSKGIHSAGRFHSVLFATDFSSHSLAALPYALSLAQENQARVVLLHVLSRGRTSALDLNQTAIAATLSKLKELIPEETANWCRPETVAEAGEPASVILEVAKRQQADLIVLGVRNLAEHLGAATHLGRATAHKIVAHAECPVLTVRG
ncbi:MAG TPA: universal stress protein [Terriglobales bacterium]|nr:universal stress protein [Terriglobales bacterium]